MVVFEQRLSVLRKLVRREGFPVYTDQGPATIVFDGDRFWLDYVFGEDPVEVDRDNLIAIIDRHFYLEAKAGVTNLGWLNSTIKAIEEEQRRWINSDCFGG